MLHLEQREKRPSRMDSRDRDPTRPKDLDLFSINLDLDMMALSDRVSTSRGPVIGPVSSGLALVSFWRNVVVT